MEKLKFSKEVISEATAIKLTDELFEGREAAEGITIDGEESKDLDDAIQLEIKDDRYILHVSIIDAGSLIKPGTEIFTEALRRVSTRYHSNSIIPMIPKTISENTLSLNPDELKPTLTFTTELDNNLDVTSFNIRKTAFLSRRRLTYAETDAIIESIPSDPECNHLRDCFNLAIQLLNKRQQSGALAIYDMIREVYTNEEGQLLPLDEEHKHKANIIVQEFMILTNGTAADYLVKKNKIFLFLNHTVKHSAPKRDEIVHQYNLALSNDKILETLRKRSSLWFNKAAYSEVLKGHFGLNLSAYTHVTSPLRRIPDLINQNIILSILDKHRTPFTKDTLNEYATNINSVYDEIKQEKSEYYKNKSSKQIAKSPNKENRKNRLLAMDARAFRTLLHHACANDIMQNELYYAVKTKIENKTIGAEHLLCILLESIGDSERWNKLRSRSLDYIAKNKKLATQLLSLAEQQGHVGILETEFIEVPAGYAARVIEKQENIATSTIEFQTSPDKKHAQHAASFDFLCQYLKNCTVPASETKLIIVEPIADTEVQNIEDNYVSRLHEVCAKIPIRSAPVYEYTYPGPVSSTVFTCICKVSTESGIKETTGTGRSKIVGKQLASKKMLEILEPIINNAQQDEHGEVKDTSGVSSEINVSESVESTNGAAKKVVDINSLIGISSITGTRPEVEIIVESENVEENYMGRLRELTDKNADITPAQYSLIMHGATNNANFDCDCTLTYKGEPLISKVTAKKKKMAQHLAAKKMLELLKVRGAHRFKKKRPNGTETLPYEELDRNEEYITKLLELSNLHKGWAGPNYKTDVSGPGHRLIFTTSCSLYTEKAWLESLGISTKKKRSQQIAARAMIKKLTVEYSDFTESEIIADAEINSIRGRELLEICTEKNWGKPIYTCNKWNKAEEPTYTCMNEIKIGDDLLETIGMGSTKLDAFQESVDLMLNKIESQKTREEEDGEEEVIAGIESRSEEDAKKE